MTSEWDCGGQFTPYTERGRSSLDLGFMVPIRGEPRRRRLLPKSTLCRIALFTQSAAAVENSKAREMLQFLGFALINH